MSKKIKIAVLDLYDGTENEGMRCIRQLISSHPLSAEYQLSWDEFDVRQCNNIPDLSYDIYISSGGPGSPLTSEENKWEKGYFHLLDTLIDYNNASVNQQKKHVFFICHSFQLACRHFHVAEVSKRNAMSFGVYPTHLLQNAAEDPVFNGLDDPFYVVDSRHYQILRPNYDRIETMGGMILSFEKERPHLPFERAIMALRFNDYMIGTQFHPEVDAAGMRLYLLKEEIRQMVIHNHGLAKWTSMLEDLEDPGKIHKTYGLILPNFLQHAIQQRTDSN